MAEGEGFEPPVPLPVRGFQVLQWVPSRYEDFLPSYISQRVTRRAGRAGGAEPI